MPVDTDAMAEMVIQTIKRATAPLLAKIAILEARPVVAPGVLELLTDNGAEIRTRLLALEARAPVPGPVGPAGQDGKDGIGLVGPMGPAGQDGKDGIGVPGPIGPAGLDGKDGVGLVGPVGPAGPVGDRGKDVDMAVVQHTIETLLTKAVAAIPLAKDGKDGRDGLTPDPEAMRTLVKAAVGEAVQALPPPINGADGVGLMGAVIDRAGHLILTLSDGQSKDLGEVVGRDGADGLQGKDVDMAAVGRQLQEAVKALPLPKDGKDGLDGLGFDTFDLGFDDAAGWRLTLGQGDRVKTFALPIPWDAGVWQAGRTYTQGACVTRQGALWIAQKDVSLARPGDEGEASRAWRLAVKSGKDGKPGPPGRDGTSG